MVEEKVPKKVPGSFLVKWWKKKFQKRYQVPFY
jgi:hypothetical protein